MAIKFKVTTSPKKTKILSIEQAEMTKMQEQATAFILQRAFKDNEIFNTVNYFLRKPEMISNQLKQIKITIDDIKPQTPSADNAANILSESLVS